MDELAVKTINFHGDELTALKDNDGIIWTGVNSFCRGIGLSKSQRDTQIQNIQSDEVLKRGCLKFQAGVFDPNNETLALQLDYVPLWLAKISITPNMRENNPELVEKLVNYQLKAKDVLASAFLPHGHNVHELTMNSRDIARILGKTHATVMNLMRERVEELEKMGFNRLEFYRDSTYKGGNNLPEPFPEFICTERGCEDFSNKLNPEAREKYLKEIADRFERMRDARDGKPVKRVERPDEDSAGPEGAIIRLYRITSGELYPWTGCFITSRQMSFRSCRNCYRDW